MRIIIIIIFYLPITQIHVTQDGYTIKGEYRRDTREDTVLSVPRHHLHVHSCTRFLQKISRHTSTMVCNNVHDSHHTQGRFTMIVVLNYRNFKFQKSLSPMSITGKVNTMTSHHNQ